MGDPASVRIVEVYEMIMVTYYTSCSWKINLTASYTMFKHKACHITIFEQKRKNKIIFNQIDNILVQQRRRQALINFETTVVGIDFDTV